MARKRTIAPAYFKHADLYDAEVSSGLPLRVAFAGLWTVADRRGVFPWSRNVKPDVLPYDPCDMLDVLEALATSGFVHKYEVGGKWYGQVPTLSKHQHFHRDEKPSTLPAPGEHGGATVPAPGERTISTEVNGRLSTSDERQATEEPPAHDAGVSDAEVDKPASKPAAPTFHAQPYLAAYATRFPGSSVPGGRFAKVLKPLEVRHGAEETLRRWTIFLAAKGELGPEYFARTWSEWGHPPPPALARHGAKPTAAEQMTASMSRIFTPAPKPSGRSP